MSVDLPNLGLLSEAYWGPESSDAVKSLLLFFDGIALLTPDYMLDRPFQADPALAEPLADKGLLEILSPEKLVSESIANELASLFEGLLKGKALDSLRDGPFAEISQSRLGLDVSPDLMGPLMARLEQHGLVKPSEDGVSRPMNRTIRAMVLGTLSQLLRQPGEELGYALQPVASGRGYGSTVQGCYAYSTESRCPRRAT